MIAKIFKYHGFHLGDDKYVNPYGYRTYENMRIRQGINQITTTYGPNDKRLNPGYSPDNIREFFRKNIKEHPWCFKCGPQYWWVLKDALPDANYVLVKRDIENTIKSQEAKRGKGKVRFYIEAFMSAIQDLHDQHGFPIIDSDEVIAGDYKSLESAMDYCGVQFDKEITDNCIDRGKWHYRSSK